MQALLKPISEETPSGESVRYTTLYENVREARREEDPRLSQGVWERDAKQADWATVEKLTLQALEKQSKDLRLAGWLAEAWLVRYGAEGGEQGLRVIESLCNRFWDTLFPEIDDDGDLDGRLGPLRWMDDNLTYRLKMLPLTNAGTQEPLRYSWIDWEMAAVQDRRLAQQEMEPKVRRGRKSEPESEPEFPTSQQLTTALLLTPTSHFDQLEGELRRFMDAVTDLEKLVDRRCGEPQAIFHTLRNALGEILEFVARTLDQKAESEPGAESEPEEGEATEEESAMAGDEPEAKAHGPGAQASLKGPGVRWGPIRNRAEAYKRLQEAADYLMRIEPHSPTPHLVRRAVSWGNMSFTELVEELVKDKHDLQAIFSLLGLHQQRK